MSRPVPGWPKGFGVTAIVIAGYGILSQSMALVMAGPMTAIFKQLGLANPFDASMTKFLWMNGAGLLLLGGLLLAGGIALLRRRQAARRLLLGWAVARIVFAVLIAPVQYNYTVGIFGKIGGMSFPTVPSVPSTLPPAAAPPPATSPAPAPAALPPGMPFPFPAREMATASMVSGLLFGCLVPVLTLIGLSFPGVVLLMRSWSLPESSGIPETNPD